MILVLLLIIHAGLLGLLQYFPSPEFFIYPYLVSHHWTPYTQILDHHFPGFVLGPINLALFKIDSPFKFHLLLIAVVLSQSLMIFRISKKMYGRSTGLWAVGIFTIWQPFFGGNVLWFDLFLAIFTLPALWFFLQSQYLLMGLALGLGLVVKQSLAPLVFGVFIYLLIKHKKIPFTFIIGACFPVSILFVYEFTRHALGDFMYWTIYFNLTTYRSLGSLAPTVHQLIWLVVPLGILIWSLTINRSRQLLFFAAWMSLSVIAGLSRFDFQHLQPAVAYFAILAGIGLAQNFTRKRLEVIFILALSIVWVGVSFARQGHFGQTYYFDISTLKLVAEIKRLTKPGEEIFLLGAQPHIYMLSDTFPPGHIFSFHLPWLLAADQEQLLVGLKKTRPRIAVYDTQAEFGTSGVNLVEYISTNYHPIEKIGSNTIYYENRH